MLRTFFSPISFGAILVGAVVTCQGGAQDKPKPKLTVLALQVEKPNAEFGGALSSRLGTAVSVAVEIPGLYVAKIDVKKSQLESMTDDKKTDLLQGAEDKGALPARIRGDSLGNSGAKEGKFARAAFHAPGVPVVGASKIKLKGSLVALIATDEKVVEKKNVSLKVGVKLPVGSIKTDLRGPDGKKAENGVPGMTTYEGTRPLKQVTATLANGDEIKYRLTNSSLGPTRGGYRVVLTEPIGARRMVPEGCTLTVTYFDKLEEITVPVDLEVGIGF